MTNPGSLLVGVALGAGLTYFLDPGRGARRRARVRDTAAHTSNLANRAVGKIARDAQHRTSGTAASLRSFMRRDPVSDDVLAERVRAKLGRLTSHPRAVEVTASDGVVTLQGPILRREASRLVRTTGRVRGVREVVNQLEVHEEAGHVPSLQGGKTPAGNRMDVLQTNWSPSTRAIVGTFGAALVATGAFRRDRPGVSAALVGATLLTRAATNLPLNRLSGIASPRRGVHVQQTA